MPYEIDLSYSLNHWSVICSRWAKSTSCFSFFENLCLPKNVTDISSINCSSKILDLLYESSQYNGTLSLKIQDEWKYVAMVIDRLLLYVFFAVTAGGTMGILFSAPNVFEYVNQTAVIEMLQKSAEAEMQPWHYCQQTQYVRHLSMPLNDFPVKVSWNECLLWAVLQRIPNAVHCPGICLPRFHRTYMTFLLPCIFSSKEQDIFVINLFLSLFKINMLPQQEGCAVANSLKEASHATLRR